MDTIRKMLAVACKDLRIMFTDRGQIITIFLVPLVVGFFSSAVFGGGTQSVRLPAIVVNQDAGLGGASYGESIASVLKGIDQVDLVEMSSPAEAEKVVAAGDSLAAIIVPADFTRRIIDYKGAEVTVMIDPTQSQYGRIITTILEEIAGSMAIQGEIRYGIRQVLAGMGYSETMNPEQARAAQAQVEGVLFTQMQQMESDAPILVQRETVSGDKVFNWSNVITLVLPGFTVMFAFFVVLTLSSELLKERDSGSLRRLVAAPLPRSALIGGKVLAYLLLVVVQVTILFGFGAVVMDMPLGRSPLGLILVTLAMGLAATALGMMVAALARSTEQAGSIALLIVFVLGILGGSFDPVNPFYRGEGPLALLSRLTPQAQAQMAYQNLIIMNGGVADVLPQVGYLLGLALAFFLVAMWRFKFNPS